MPKKNIGYRRQSPPDVHHEPPKQPKEYVTCVQLPVIEKVVLYSIFMVFKLINYLTSFLPFTDNTTEDASIFNMETLKGKTISISYPKKFEIAIESVDHLKEQLDDTRRENENLKYELKRARNEYSKLVKDMDGSNKYDSRFDYRAKRRQQDKECEARATLSNSIDQIYTKIDHLRLKCKNGVQDLQKIKDSSQQCAHVKEICSYHIAALEQFISWLNAKAQHVKKFEQAISYQPIDVRMSDILKFVNLGEIITILNGAILYFFKKYYVILMLTIADKEYIENNIQRKANTSQEKAKEEKCIHPEKPVIVNDDLFTEHCSETVPNDQNYESVNENKFEEEDWSFYEFTHTNGIYHNLYTFLLEYLGYSPENLAKFMDAVRLNNKGTFKNMTVFEIAKKVEKIALERGMMTI